MLPSLKTQTTRFCTSFCRIERTSHGDLSSLLTTVHVLPPSAVLRSSCAPDHDILSTPNRPSPFEASKNASANNAPPGLNSRQVVPSSSDTIAGRIENKTLPSLFDSTGTAAFLTRGAASHLSVALS